MSSIVVYNTLFTGKFLIHRPSMTSTNAFAQNLISKTKPIDGTVIITDEQINGKGQGRNLWQSDPGKNITCSIIYDTSFLLAEQQYFLNMAVATALVNSLSVYLDKEQLSIKWPNDILFSDSKIGGILIENSIRGQHLRYSVIGIGININQLMFDDLPHATSVLKETGENHQLNEVLNSVCEELEIAFLALKSGGSAEIYKSYNELLYRNGKSVNFVDGSRRFKAKVNSVDTLGRLILEEEVGRTEYSFGQIQWQYSSVGD